MPKETNDPTQQQIRDATEAAANAAHVAIGLAREVADAFEKAKGPRQRKTAAALASRRAVQLGDCARAWSREAPNEVARFIGESAGDRGPVELAGEHYATWYEASRGIAQRLYLALVDPATASATVEAIAAADPGRLAAEVRADGARAIQAAAPARRLIRVADLAKCIDRRDPPFRSRYVRRPDKVGYFLKVRGARLQKLGKGKFWWVPLGDVEKVAPLTAARYRDWAGL